ncbi:TPA: hypothetical protein ACGQX6_001495 [Klebsiella michiganensis]
MNEREPVYGLLTRMKSAFDETKISRYISYTILRTINLFTVYMQLNHSAPYGVARRRDSYLKDTIADRSGKTVLSDDSLNNGIISRYIVLILLTVPALKPILIHLNKRWLQDNELLLMNLMRLFVETNWQYCVTIIASVWLNAFRQ